MSFRAGGQPESPLAGAGPPQTHTTPALSSTDRRAQLSCISHSRAGRGEPTRLLQQRLLEALVEEPSPFYLVLTSRNQPRFHFPGWEGPGQSQGCATRRRTAGHMPPAGQEAPQHTPEPSPMGLALLKDTAAARESPQALARHQPLPLNPPELLREQREMPLALRGATHMLTGLSAASATAESRWTLQARP